MRLRATDEAARQLQHMINAMQQRCIAVQVEHIDACARIVGALDAVRHSALVCGCAASKQLDDVASSMDAYRYQLVSMGLAAAAAGFAADACAADACAADACAADAADIPLPCTATWLLCLDTTAFARVPTAFGKLHTQHVEPQDCRVLADGTASRVQSFVLVVPKPAMEWLREADLEVNDGAMQVCVYGRNADGFSFTLGHDRDATQVRVVLRVAGVQVWTRTLEPAAMLGERSVELDILPRGRLPISCREFEAFAVNDDETVLAAIGPGNTFTIYSIEKSGAEWRLHLRVRDDNESEYNYGLGRCTSIVFTPYNTFVVCEGRSVSEYLRDGSWVRLIHSHEGTGVLARRDTMLVCATTQKVCDTNNVTVLRLHESFCHRRHIPLMVVSTFKSHATRDGMCVTSAALSPDCMHVFLSEHQHFISQYNATNGALIRRFSGCSEFKQLAVRGTAKTYYVYVLGLGAAQTEVYVFRDSSFYLYSQSLTFDVAPETVAVVNDRMYVQNSGAPRMYVYW